jgi:drug/metabolite transporter (DMT)-like permease
MNMYVPIIIVILSNTFYHICTKSTPENLNPFASLTVTYLIGAVVSVILYFLTVKNPNLLTEYGKLHWSSFVLGIAIVGLEAGFLLMYRVGWNVSTGQVVSSIALAVVLVFVGYLFYKEAITVSKIAGILVCMVGLYLINK